MGSFSTVTREYINRAITKAEAAGISKDSTGLIQEFTNELRSTPGITIEREYKLTYDLLAYAKFIPSFREATLPEIFAAINQIRDRPNGRKNSGYKKNTIHDYVVIIKQFHRWMVNTEKSHNLKERDLLRIRVPPKECMTKTAEQLLTDEEIKKMLDACLQNQKYRALLAVMYEGGFRPIEVATLTWDHVKFSHPGVSINTARKTMIPRYVRLIMAAEYLAAWKRGYPGSPKGDALVFLSQKGGPVEYGAMAKQIKIIAKRAGIEKNVTPYLFRHSRITHLIQHQVQESIIKLMMWGNVETGMLKTYAHLTRDDVDKEIATLYGIQQRNVKKDELAPRQCMVCYEIAGPTAEYCPKCGTPLSEGKKEQMDRLLKSLQNSKKYKEFEELAADFERLKTAMEKIKTGEID